MLKNCFKNENLLTLYNNISQDDSLPDITGKDFAVEKMTNTICLVFTNRKAEIDAYRITVREILRNGGLQPVHSLRHPALDKRVSDRHFILLN